MRLTDRHYVYRHIRNDTGEIFYVGKGSHKSNKRPTFERAKAEHKNPHWMRIVKNHGFNFEIMVTCNTDLIAQKKEKEFIKLYGRRDLGLGSLVNFTDGGDGHAGIIVSEDLRKKRSIISSRPRSQAFIDAVRRARKNGGNGGVVKLGDKLPESWVINLARAKLGSKNPMFGKVTKIARKVIDKNGVQYPSATVAAKSIGIPMKSLYNQLSGHRQNWSGMKFV